MRRNECHSKFICTRHTGCGGTCHNRTSSTVHTDLDVLEEDASTSLVLEGQQLLSVLPLLPTVLLEEMAEAWKSHIVTGEVKGL